MTMWTSRVKVGLALGAVALSAAAVLTPIRAQQGTIKIGELNSYKAQPAFLEPYRKGWQLAVEEINAAGGLLGKQLEVVSRDDTGVPGDAVRVAEELASRENVVLLTGGFLSHVGLAISDFAKNRKILFVAAEPLTDKLVWEAGHRYTFRLRASTYMQTSMLVAEAVKLKKKRWAIVYPNYEYGQSAVASFKALMKAAQPDVEFVAEQASPLGKIDAGAVAQAIGDAKPDGIFNVTFGADLAKFVREGNTRSLFKDRVVLSLLSGEPEYLDPLKDETPAGWIVTGYPWQAIDTPEHKAFVVAYQKKYNDYPRLGSVVGYAAMQTVAAAIKKAGSTDTDKLIAAMQGLELSTPFGKIVYRAGDHQSTMGAYVGRLAVKDGKGMMVDWRYEPGERHLPSEEEGRKRRPAQ
ncbi:MAG TPA: ABC transporter substrate-binding protein [Hyphomicrobiaceae bacterium]|nr:ABC transporter substrate-binding protein [Hyphomicrobiaceae bacterium]